MWKREQLPETVPKYRAPTMQSDYQYWFPVKKNKFRMKRPTVWSLWKELALIGVKRGIFHYEISNYAVDII